MNIKKFNEALSDYNDYKEYDEYSNLNIDIINNWNSDISEANNFISNFSHELHQYSDFITEYVVCNNNDKIIIPTEIKLIHPDYEKKFKIYFKDIHQNLIIQSTDIKYIKHISEIAETDQQLFMELYEIYIKKYKAPYMDVFGKEEFKHLFTSNKYNL